VFEKFKKFLRGEFVCVRCGKTWFSFGSFGFGKMICPECYNGEAEWLFPDMSYCFNRWLFSGRSEVKVCE